MNLKKALGFAALLIILLPSFSNAGVVAMPQLSTTASGFLFNRTTNTFDSMVTVTNNGSANVGVPFHLVVNNISPSYVSLYNTSGTAQNGSPYVDVALTNNVLAPGATISVPVKFVNLGKGTISASFTVEAQPFQDGSYNTVQVNALFYPESGGGSVGAGFNVLVDSVVRGTTDASGSALVKIPFDAQVIEVSNSRGPYGKINVTGNSVETIYVDSGKEVANTADVRVDFLQQGMLPINSPQISIRLFQKGKQIQLGHIYFITLHGLKFSGTPISIEDIFSIKADGSLVASTDKFLSAWGDTKKAKELEISVSDKQSAEYDPSNIQLMISQYKVQAKLAAPPSQPKLQLNGIKVVVSVEGTPIKFTTESGVDGSIPLPLLPFGRINFTATTTQNSIQYNSNGSFDLSKDSVVSVNLLAPADAAKNIPSIILY